MQIQFTARHCEIGPDLRAFAQARIQRLEKFASDIHGVHVILTQERRRHLAEITMRLNHHDVVVKEEHDDPRAALELAADRVEQHVRRFKEKRVEHHRGEGAKTVNGVDTTPDDAAPDED